MKRINIKVLAFLLLCLLMYIYFYTSFYSDNVPNSYCPWRDLHATYSCSSSWSVIYEGLYYLTGAMSIVFFVMLFFPKSFYAWLKLAVWFIPVLAFVAYVLLSFKGSIPFLGEIRLFDEGEVYLAMSAIYIALSTIIIVLRHFKPEVPKDYFKK